MILRIACAVAVCSALAFGDEPAVHVESNASGTPAATPTEAPAAPTSWSWRTSEDEVALCATEQGEQRVVWRFHYGRELDVPYFHPLATPAGQVLSWNSPPDHVWHHGLWFSWKFLNGVNYWEVNRETGKPDGRTQWDDVSVTTHENFAATISMSLRYGPAEESPASGSGGIVLREQRRIAISAPDPEGLYHIDWMSTFASQDETVVLDRTPPREQSWGGYAGLSVRFAREFRERQACSLSGPVTFGDGDRHRSRAAAMDYNGLIEGRTVGLAFLDHPANPRHPTPWYLIRSPVMGYINAAVLHDEPMSLQDHESMTLRYRLIVHPQRWGAEQLRTAYREWTGTGPESR